MIKLTRRGRILVEVDGKMRNKSLVRTPWQERDILTWERDGGYFVAWDNAENVELGRARTKGGLVAQLEALDL